MGWRFRKSFQIAPGVRVNFGRKTASLRVGGRGFGLTSGTSGSRWTVGIPGTGLSYSQRIDGRRAPVGSALVGLFWLAVSVIFVIWLLF